MNDLVSQDPNSLVPAYENPNEAVFKEVSGTSFLPRLQLFIANSDAVKSELIPMNHYGFVTRKDQIESLGKEVDVILICWRPRALDTSDRQNIRSSCNVKSELFQEIKSKSGIKNSGCQYGPEYLIWIPVKEEFATFFLGSISGRNEAVKVNTFLKKACTLKSRLIDSGDYKWQSPTVFPCSNIFDAPPHEDQLTVINTFLSQPDQTGAEKIEEDIQQRDR